MQRASSRSDRASKDQQHALRAAKNAANSRDDNEKHGLSSRNQVERAAVAKNNQVHFLVSMQERKHTIETSLDDTY
jgi:hypothetical protein